MLIAQGGGCNLAVGAQLKKIQLYLISHALYSSYTLSNTKPSKMRVISTTKQFLTLKMMSEYTNFS